MNKKIKVQVEQKFKQLAGNGRLYLPQQLPYKQPNMNQIVKQYQQRVKQYLHGLMFPEEAVSGSYIAKQPSYISLPTSNVVFKEQMNFSVPSSQKFAVIWVPNFLCTVPSLDKHVPNNETYPEWKKFYSHLYYCEDFSTSDRWMLHTSYRPAVDLSKYRLVSAKISVQYNGAILNQSGQLHSCVIYDDLPVFCGTCPQNSEDVGMDLREVSADLGRSLNSYCDVEKIRNGLWPKYVNITTSSGQIDNLALPSDPTDHTFFPLNHYYAKEPEVFDTHVVGKPAYYATSTDGGHLSYVYFGQGIPQGTNITVLVYYNFEIIPTQSTATFLRASKDKDRIRNFITDKFDVVADKLTDYAANNNYLLGGDSTNSTKVNSNVNKFLNTLTNILFSAVSGNFMNLFSLTKNVPKIDGFSVNDLF